MAQKQDLEAGHSASPAGLPHFASKPAVFQLIGSDRVASHLTWKNVGFSVKTPKGRKQILTNVTGELRPGALTCILGPSGCGKTTLLNLLSGRMGAGGRFSAEVAGDFALNGIPIKPTEQQHCFGYVMQDDALFATETPREVLWFSAKLRLQGVDDKKIMALLDDLLASLGISNCADTLVGNEMIKGISGGQRKRTSIGAELITNPAITFLDEPTSGLDTAAAYNVCTVLKELANANQAVMCTIHQPSSEVFHLFDNAIFLAQGQIVYQGPPAGIRPYFDKLNFQCPADYNPADFVMFLVEMADEAKFATLTESWQTELAARKEESVEDKKADLPKRPPSKGFCVELIALVARQLRNVRRDKASLGGRFGLSIFLNLVFSFIFWQVGNMSDSGYEPQSHAGAVTMIGINAMFGCTQPTLLAFPSERPVFLREHASNMYGVIPYFLSKTVVEFMLLLAQIFVVMIVDYWLMHLNGNFFGFVLAYFLLGAACSSIGLMLGCCIGNVKTAIEVVPLAFVPQILFAGFFIKITKIPAVLRWIQYICSLKWGMNIALINEFDGTIYSTAVLSYNDIKPDMNWLNVIVLVALIVGFRIIGMILLKRKAKTLYG